MTIVKINLFEGTIRILRVNISLETKSNKFY